MFGDMEGMMAKLKEAQAKIEETKKRLNTVMVDGDAGNGMVIATVTGNMEVKNIAIDDALLEDKEALEDYLIVALNKAIEKANQINETEMAAAAKGGLPDIPGMDMFKS
jgi:DNA-binding YbaB/EbfC family protein